MLRGAFQRPLLKEDSSSPKYQQHMRWLGVPYIFQVAWRSFLPSEYPTRTVFFDTPLSSPMLARCLAAVGEICFGTQLAMATVKLSSDVEDALQVQSEGDDGLKKSGQIVTRTVHSLAGFQVACDVAGQCCACVGTATTDTRFFYYEGRLWMFWSISVTLSGLLLWVRCQKVPRRRRQQCVEPAALSLLGGGLAVTLFMALSYCPMCLERWQVDKAEGRQPLPLWKGAWDAAVTRVPTRAWSYWKDEVLWVSGYFTIGVWACLRLTYAPRLD